MTRRSTFSRAVTHLLTDLLSNGDAGDLLAYLAAEGSLPEPGTDLEPAAEFAGTVQEFAAADPDDLPLLLDLCMELACIAPEDAPTGDPGEFFGICGIRGIGAIGSLSPGHAVTALKHLGEAATDPRRRIREAVAMAVRDLLFRQRDTVIPELESWVEGGSWPAMQAAAAGVVEPDLLAEADLAAVALRFHRKILIRIYTAKERHSDAFHALRETLGRTLGVVIAAIPTPGFEYLRQLATLDDQDLRWIVQETLNEDRLGIRYPETMQHIRAQMGISGR